LQCVALFYSMLQCVVVHVFCHNIQIYHSWQHISCNNPVLQRVAACCSTRMMYQYTTAHHFALQRTSLLQCVAVCCSTSVLSQYTTAYRLMCSLRGRGCCSVLQCVAVPVSGLGRHACCSVLQCVAVCCSVLQCVTLAVSYDIT